MNPDEKIIEIDSKTTTLLSEMDTIIAHMGKLRDRLKVELERERDAE